MPGFLTTEGDPWVEDGITYRRMNMTWPSHLATYNADQVLYLDETGLIVWHDHRSRAWPPCNSLSSY